nr:phage portal protein [Micromonospora sp. DSM 115978]
MMRSWWRRWRGPARPAQVDGPTAVDIDGVRYPARPGAMPSGGGVWRSWAGRLRRAVGALGGAEARSVEQRTIGSVPWSVGDTLSPASASQERALRMGPVFSAVRLIADTVSTLPLKAYRRQGDVRQPITTLPALFRDLDDRGELVTWLKRCVTSLMLRGNAYGYVTSRDGMGYPTVVQWLDPSDVGCNDINPWAPIWYWQGRVIPSEDLLHIPWFVIAGKAQGLSPIEAYAVTTNTGLQAQEYGSTWFAAGGVPPGTFRNTRKEVNQQIASAISDRLVAAVRSRRPIVFGADWEYNAVTVPPEQAQFIETMRMSATQIAAIYGLPPEMIGGSTGDGLEYKTEEARDRRLNSSLRPLLVLLEDAFSSILPSRQHVRFNADAVARADLKTRYEAYEIAQRIGLLTIDEIRALEDLPPLPPGQQPAALPAPGAQPGQQPPLRVVS